MWLKEIAPSTELRKWFEHDPSKWLEFRGRYKRELSQNDDLSKLLKGKARAGTITLIYVYAARDEEHNEALVLMEFLEKTSKPAHRTRSG